MALVWTRDIKTKDGRVRFKRGAEVLYPRLRLREYRDPETGRPLADFVKETEDLMREGGGAAAHASVEPKRARAS